MTEEEKYMNRCIQLARNGACHVSPNPMVGAVIVCDGKIIGEGYHAKCGQAHAEVNAISSVENPSMLKRSTIYVSLEPCSHYGKTPPCADLIIEKQLAKVVIGCTDPFAKVSGRGIQKLRDAGIEVVVGVLQEQCKALIKHFVTFNTLRRPYIYLKWAESTDGFIDVNRTDGNPVILSSPLTSMLVHKRRAEVDGILVGTRTALLDNPSLNVRNWQGNNPLRIVLDRQLKLPKNLHLFDGSIKTLVFTSKECASLPMIEYVRIDFDTDILPQVIKHLYDRNIQTLLVEGGGKTLQTFINANLWDEAFVEKANCLLGEGVKAPRKKGEKNYAEEYHFGTKFIHYIR
ncbi:MAG: bifunctional diaminohydroxyphosphoribosylaminopyrimidine deaminase/5-amino-6-(5-phosphoribosylamino)uracil reductase RibD [Bacteroidaceae bacterium]